MSHEAQFTLDGIVYKNKIAGTMPSLPDPIMREKCGICEDMIIEPFFFECDFGNITIVN